MLQHVRNLLNSAKSLIITNSTTDNSISVDQNGNVGTSVATDGAIHVENTGNTGIGLGVYSNLDSNSAAPLISVHADNPGFDQTLLNMRNDGTGRLSYLYQAATPASRVFEIYSDAAITNSPMCLIKSDNASSTEQVLQIWDDGSASSLKVDKNNTGLALEVTHDDTGNSASISIIRNGNSANDIPSLQIHTNNAGAGNPIGIDFSQMSDGEATMRFNSLDTDLSAKSPETDAEAGWIPVDVGGTIYAVPMYALA